MTLDEMAIRLTQIENFQTVDVSILADMFGCSVGRMIDAIDHIQYLRWKHTYPTKKVKATLFK